MGLTIWGYSLKALTAAPADFEAAKRDDAFSLLHVAIPAVKDTLEISVQVFFNQIRYLVDGVSGVEDDR